MDPTFIHFRRKSIFWNVQLKPTIHPLKALGSAIVGEGGVVNDVNTTQIAYSRWRQSKTDNNYQCNSIQILAQKGQGKTWSICT